MMNTKQVKAQLAYMKSKFEAEICDALSKLIEGDDDRNLHVLKNVDYNCNWLRKLELAEKYVHMLPKEEAAPKPVKPPKKS